MDRFSQLINNELRQLKARRMEAIHKAAKPFDRDIDKLEKLLAALNDEVQGRPASQVISDMSVEMDKQMSLLEPDAGISIKEKVKRIGINTQEMAVKILADNSEGMLALDILDAINDRWKIGLVRSSLSPQLSRLKAKGILAEENGFWRLSKKEIE